AGRADAGVVYATDAAQSKKVRVAFTVPEGDAPRIVYPAAALMQGKAPRGGLAFVRFLQTEGARKEFHRLGFLDASTEKDAPDAGVTGTAPGGSKSPDAGVTGTAPGGSKSPDAGVAGTAPGGSKSPDAGKGHPSP
ncbi:substrate-binding domain-containing protein, partial [Corallococcus sp. CA049B]|uniref:substrate-binding domain-containing protein n=1 Tax=Corallococcus sp. CA049B TaxID=2316730 RepID=UPI001F228411